MLKDYRPVLLLCALLAACHRESDVRGVYVAQDHSGALFLCDEGKLRVVNDSALRARYELTVGGHVPAFVRLRGIRGRSGSPKGGGQWWFQVHEILEVRPRVAEDCPGVAQPVTPLLSNL